MSVWGPAVADEFRGWPVACLLLVAGLVLLAAGLVLPVAALVLLVAGSVLLVAARMYYQRTSVRRHFRRRKNG